MIGKISLVPASPFKCQEIWTDCGQQRALDEILKGIQSGDICQTYIGNERGYEKVLFDFVLWMIKTFLGRNRVAF